MTKKTSSTLKSTCLAVIAVSTVFGLTGCKSPQEHRQEANDVAYDIIKDKQVDTLGKAEPFTIERPSDVLRRRLITDQDLLHATDLYLGPWAIEPIEQWPDPNYLEPTIAGDNIVDVPEGKPLQFTLFEALQIGAANSFRYQSEKEDIFSTALDLDLERNEFRNIFNQALESNISTDSSGSRTVSGTTNSSVTDFSRQLKNGATFTSNLAVDLANLITLGGASSLGLRADASVSVPLMRGSGEFIVTEPLTQAERNVMYSIYNFERFKKTFAVDIATEYLGVLRQLDRIKNAEENYRRLIMSVRRARRLADAGQLTEIQVDQAVQDELRARENWIAAQQSYERAIDNFKILLGLPTDAEIELDRDELDRLVRMTEGVAQVEDDEEDYEPVPADAPINLPPPSREDAGPYELDPYIAQKLAIENRKDLEVARGAVYDEQRSVAVAADGLRGELTLLGEAASGSRRSVGTAASDDAQIRADKAFYSALLTMDLPVERTAERNQYRNSLIQFESAIRDLGSLTDSVKLDVRNRLRDLLTTRETLQIQARAVMVAEKRVESTNLFLQAGRAEIRDVLEAQSSLLNAQNALTSAIINYRIAELELQRDMGLLDVDSQGLWTEFDPETLKNEQ
ncbi:outer membrane channel protein [Anaerohalosphaera lusitana]|uniref:Outer membrane channel protein n=1 Tax=Anaerohalosphaera lusitana TaxID=1936003 RepID=A0A1U9NRL8_9BACT|nr:TolC family protein [Anaerohalosphaera lusitana]AQT70260.1 outer membrane channel protein [Anaerohalosphaera lusitana]